MLHLGGTKHRKPVILGHHCATKFQQCPPGKEMDKGRTGVVADGKHWIFITYGKKKSGQVWNLAAARARKLA
jgi:hypothetical protein